MYGPGVNFGLLESLRNIPTPIDAMGQAAKTSLTNAQANQANTAAQATQQDMGFKKLETINKIAGSVMMNPTQENLMAAKQMASQAGLDVSGIPDDINSAMPFIKNAYAASGQQIEIYKAQAQIEMARATMGLKAADTAANIGRLNVDAQNKGITAPGQSYMTYPGMNGSSNGIQGFPSLGIPVQNSQAQTGQAAGTTANNNMPLMMTAAQPKALQQQPQAQQVGNTQPLQPQQQYPGLKDINASNINFPAESKAEVKQGEDWQSFMKSSSAGANGYLGNRNAIYDAMNANNSRGMSGTLSGLLPDSWTPNTQENQRINKDANFLMRGLVAQVAASGISRLDIPIVRALLGSLPQAGKFTGVNADILQKLYAANEVLGRIAPSIIQKLNSLGIRDPLAAQNVINQVLERTGAYDNKTGYIDINKLNSWEKNFNDILDPRTIKNALYNTNANPNDIIKSLKDNKIDPTSSNINTLMQQSKQKDISYGDYVEGMKIHNPTISEGDINQQWQQKFAPQSNQQISANTPPQTTGVAQMAQSPSQKMPQAALAMNTNQASPQQQTMPAGAAANNNPRFQAAMQVAPRLAEAIAQGMETTGYSPQEKYAAIGPVTKSGDRGYGKFQIMGSNIPAWTNEILGRPMTPKQFLANPQAQDAVAQVKLAQYISQYGSLQDAASVWFSGKPSQGNNRSDGYHNVPQYITAVGKKYASLQ